jgi:hypothetical protein
MALPPVLAGAAQVTTTELAPPVAATVSGTEGATEATAVNDAEAGDTNEVVLLPLGVTVKVYAVPLVSPDTVQLCEPVGATVLLAKVQVRPPGDEVTVYVEATPSAVNVTTAAPLLAKAAVGWARKFTPGMAAFDARDTVDVPPPVGVTTKVYDVPLVSPDTLQLCDPVSNGDVEATTHVRPPGVEVAV